MSQARVQFHFPLVQRVEIPVAELSIVWRPRLGRVIVVDGKKIGMPRSRATSSRRLAASTTESIGLPNGKLSGFVHCRARSITGNAGRSQIPLDPPSSAPGLARAGRRDVLSEDRGGHPASGVVPYRMSVARARPIRAPDLLLWNSRAIPYRLPPSKHDRVRDRFSHRCLGVELARSTSVVGRCRTLFVSWERRPATARASRHAALSRWRCREE